ncbi:flowering time control protein FPA-like [Solanum pennellii]|uniref:Flowering time control protein FPA-like n=1 Tax=Solanum pennellii TaxID=28526 RepID=A0ABM1VD98_SOLPN|nr:flowering time control protein FPA-like [Solanum pennellii]
MAPGEAPSKSLWVGNLAPDITDEDLVSLFQNFGPVNSITRCNSRGYGFVLFRNIHDSKEAKDALQGSFFHGNALRIEFAKPEQEPEFKDGHYPNRSIDHSHDLPSKVLCISYPPTVHADNNMIHNAMILLGEINRIKTFNDKNFSLVEFRSVEEAQRAREGLQGKLFNDPRITIEYYYPFPPAQTMAQNPPILAPSAPITISPGQHYIWNGIIARKGTSVCRAVCVPTGESVICVLPDIVNCTAGTGLDKLTKHYSDAAIGFNIFFFLPDTDHKEYASYAEFLRYLSAKDRVEVAKLSDGTHMFLVPPSDFISKVLKVDGPACIYGVVLKYSPHTTSATVLPK